jgi:diamine N-acetyltransferase
MMSAPDAAAPPIVNIIGERIALGPLDRTFIPLLQRWHNDLAAVAALGLSPRPLTREQMAARHDTFAAANDEARFAVYTRGDWRPIGLATLPVIDFRHGTARYVIFIGERDCRGKGYGTETTRLMLDYAFTALGLHSVMLTAYAFNLAGIRAYAKAGFRECGRRRAAYVMGGTRWDIVYMDCLASEFTSPTLQTIFTPDEPRVSVHPPVT